MNGLDVIWVAAAAACLSLAMLHSAIWALSRGGKTNLAFAGLALSVTGIAACELGMMHAQTLEAFAAFERWIHVPIFTTVLFAVLYVHLFFGSDRPWLGHAAWGTRLLTLAVNFAQPGNVTHSAITGIRRIQVLGQTVTVADGPVNPWTWLARASLVLLLAFIADSAVRSWRAGGPDGRRRALIVGGSLFLFISGGAMQAAMVMTGAVEGPYAVSLFFLGAVVTSGWELAHEVVRASRLTTRLTTTEQSLDEQETRLKNIVQSAMDGIVTVDREWQIVQLNEAAGRMFRCSPADVLWQDFDRFVPERQRRAYRARFSRFADSLATNGTGGLPARVTGLRADGEEFPIEASMSWSSTNGGSLLTMILRDVTEQRRAEAESRTTRAEIAHLSRVALVSELAGAVAHELNQPLGAILSNAQAMRRILSHDDPDGAYLSEILADIIDDDRRAGEIIHRLRALLRKGELEPEPVALSELVQQMLRLFHGELVERRVSVRSDFGDDSAMVSGDRVQLQQVLLNLLMNACDAMADLPPGQRILTVRTERLEHSIRVSVSDRGKGVAPEERDRIFEPFYTTKPEGLGMGLAIGRRIVLTHGGRLEVTNNGQGGATFHVTLPALE